MKLRIQNGSLRFRLTQGEVSRLRNFGRVEGEVRFAADRTLRYAVAGSVTIRRIAVDSTADCVCVLVPHSVVESWAGTDQVTIEDHGPVHVLVEKDFQCLHGPDARDPDAWPNPLAQI